MGNCCNDESSHIFGRQGYVPNHIFDPNPPSYYGDWSQPHGECIRNQISVCQPGMMTGLYNINGPLHICPAVNTASILTRVTTDAKIILTINFNYTDSSLNQSIDIIPGVIYTITYVENGDLKKCSGRVSSIYKVQSLENDSIYKIKLDCSANYSNSVVIIKSDQIRYAYRYMQYAEEDPTIDKSIHKNGTTAADIVQDAVVTNAVLDANDNIITGNIISGTIVNGNTVDGIAQGYNSNGHKISVINGSTVGGIIQGGIILSGILRSGDVDKERDDKGIIRDATIKGILMNVVISDSEVINGKTSKGTIIDPEIVNSTVQNAEVTGDNMVTTGGITIGNLTTKGTTIGGTAKGGTARGTIQGKQYIIENGITTGSKLVTTGGILVGGTITGGTQVGNAIVNAVITGGTVTGGTTTGGTTTDGEFKLASSAKLPVVPFTTEDSSGSTSVHFNKKDYQKIFKEEMNNQADRIASEIDKLRKDIQTEEDVDNNDTDVSDPEVDSLFKD